MSKRFCFRDAGGSSLEYGIIVGLVSTAVVTTIFALGVSVGDLYQVISLNVLSALR
ncbi:MAG: Flp family type IVb pilin [Rhodospirillales bacterium]